jgi:hypothetical protein
MHDPDQIYRTRTHTVPPSASCLHIEMIRSGGRKRTAKKGLPSQTVEYGLEKDPDYSNRKREAVREGCFGCLTTTSKACMQQCSSSSIAVLGRRRRNGVQRNTASIRSLALAKWRARTGLLCASTSPESKGMRTQRGSIEGLH